MLCFNLSPYYLPPASTSSFLLQGRGELCPTNTFLTRWNKRAGKTGSWHCALCKGQMNRRSAVACLASGGPRGVLPACPLPAGGLPLCAVHQGQAPGCTLPAAASSPLHCPALAAAFSSSLGTQRRVTECENLCTAPKLPHLQGKRHGRVWARYHQRGCNTALGLDHPRKDRVL